MKKLCKKAGVPYFRFHSIRHSGASYLDNNGVPISSTQDLLGHSDRRTTERYCHRTTEALRKAILMFDKPKQKNSLAKFLAIVNG